jgi:hypothetical protein
MRTMLSWLPRWKLTVAAHHLHLDYAIHEPGEGYVAPAYQRMYPIILKVTCRGLIIFGMEPIVGLRDNQIILEIGVLSKSGKAIALNFAVNSCSYPNETIRLAAQQSIG